MRRAIRRFVNLSFYAAVLTFIPLNATGDLIAYWSFDADATDSNGNSALDGTFIGTARIESTNVAPVLGNAGCLVLDGSPGRVSLPAPLNSIIGALPQGALEAWVYLSDAASSSVVFQSAAGGSNNDISIAVHPQPGGDLLIHSNIDDFDMYATHNNFQTNEWHHMVWTWNGTETKLFFNRVLISTHVTSEIPDFMGNEAYIGSDTQEINYWKGRLDEVRLYDTEFDSSPPFQLPPDCDGLAFNPNLPNRQNLVLVTHGRSDGDGVLQMAWVNDLRDALRDAIDSPGSTVNPSDWVVAALDWTDQASVPLVSLIGSGREVGAVVGQCLAQYQYEQVHLIAHSAGAYVVDEMARILHQDPSTQAIHITLLDAFVPRHPNVHPILAEILLDPEYVSWADHYYIDDPIPLTQQPLCHAHNIDLEDILVSPPPSHSYPHVWYEETVSAPTSMNGGLAYGFVRSLEGGGWAQSLSDYPRGNGIFCYDDLVQIATGIKDFALSTLISSTTGIVTIVPGGVSLQTGSPVWLTTPMEIPDGTNYLELDYQFTGATDGYLTVSLNQGILFAADQRVRGSGLNSSGTLIIPPQPPGAGEPLLGVRLDPVDPMATQSASVYISNVEFGTIQVLNSAREWADYQ